MSRADRIAMFLTVAALIVLAMVTVFPWFNIY